LLGSIAATIHPTYAIGATGAADASETSGTPDPSETLTATEDSTASVTAVSLETNSAADDYASELISQYRKNNADLSSGQTPKEMVLVHLGDAPPAQLKWVILRLDAERIPYRLMLVTAQELEQTLADGQQKAEQLVLTQSQGSPDEGLTRVRDLGQQSRLFLKQLFGLPRGLTLWFFDFPALGLKKNPMIRTQEERSKELRRATISAMTAGAQVWATFYVTHGHALLSPGMAAGLPVFMSWVWLWAYNARSWGGVMSQGKAFKETEPGVWKIKNSDVFFYTGAYMRGLLTNAIVMSCFLNGDIFHWKTAGLMATNAGINLFARSWIDKWIIDRQATVLPDGRVEVQPGQHAPATTIQIRFWWEFGYGILKTLQLVGYSSVLDGVYQIMGAVGLSKKLYAERFALMRKAREVKERLQNPVQKPETNADLGPITRSLICEGAFL
jgi:hypothetical protein